MLHACLLPITLCFTGTSWCFYGFSVTNILTRCHSASFCFLLFFIPEKLQKKYSRNQQWKLFYEVSHRRSPGARRGHPGGGLVGPHHPQARLGLAGRARAWWGPPEPLPGPPFRLLISPGLKTLNIVLNSRKEVRRRRHRENQISGDRSLCSGTLPERGSAPGRISIDSTTVFIAIADSYDEE